MTCETTTVAPPRLEFLDPNQSRTLDSNQISHELALICRTAATACSDYLQWARTQVSDPTRVELKADHHDPVTVFDRAVERALCTILGAFIPASYLVGEELGLSLLAGDGLVPREDGWVLHEASAPTPAEGADAVPLRVMIPSLAAHPQVRSLASRVRWIVDPIDGTANFAAGLHYFGTSIACQLDGVVVAAAIHIPCQRITAWANAEAGWWESPEGFSALDSRGAAREREAVLVSYFPTSADLKRYRDTWGQLVADLTDAFRAIRRPGAAAVDLAQLAAGNLGAVFATHLKPWDVAAGLHLAQVSGAEVLMSAPPHPPSSEIANDFNPYHTCGYGPRIAVSAAGLSAPALRHAFDEVDIN